MYIPFSFFGGNICTGSGFCFSYGNTSISTTDDITYTSLCGVASTPLSITPNSVEKFSATTTPSGLAATTTLVGQPYTVSSSCGLIQPRSYTFTETGTCSDIYYAQTSINSLPDRIFINSTSTITSVFRPQLMYRNAQTANATFTLTDNGPIGSVVQDTWNTGGIRKYTCDLQTGSFSINTSINNKPIISNFSLPALNNSPGLRIQLLSETTPFIVHNIPFVAGRDYFPVFSILTATTLYQSSSCWEYEISNVNTSPSLTFNYLDCNNVSSSIVVNSGSISTICAKYNSIVIPTLSAGKDLVIRIGEAC